MISDKKNVISGSAELRHSQNFLHSPGLVSRLLKMSGIGKEDRVVEIGPGKGIITKQLVKKCRKVFGIEYDFYLYEKLKQRFSGDERIEIIHGDFLEARLPEQGSYKVFSNIPFHITAEALTKLTTAPNPPEDAYVVLQEEAARKYAGNPYNRECLRSLLLKPYFELKIRHWFQKTDFTPVPNVNIVLLQIKKRKPPLLGVEEEGLYKDFVSYVFCKGRGDMKERTGQLFTGKQLRRLAGDIGFEMTDAPVDISFPRWLELFRYFAGGVCAEKRRLVQGAYEKYRKQQGKINKVHRSRLTPR